MTTGMGSVDLAGIVERDADLGDISLADLTAWNDRRALLGLLREAREFIESGDGMATPVHDYPHRQRDCEACRARWARADVLTLLAALDPATTEPKEPE